jgi:hypothetical protein
MRGLVEYAAVELAIAAFISLAFVATLGVFALHFVVTV